MAALVIPATVLVRMVWGYGAVGAGVNVLGFRKLTGAAVDQTVANSIDAAIKSAHTSSGLRALQPTQISLNYAAVRDISSPNLPEFIGTGASQPGTAAAGQALPPQIALVVTLRTAKAGKPFRGRSFVPFWHSSANDTSGNATAAAQTAAKAFIDGIDSGLTPLGFDLAVVSRLQVENNVVTATIVRNAAWDTIRKRATAGI